MREPVSFCVVRATREDGREELREIARVHLPVAGHHDADLDVELERTAITRHDCSSHTPIHRMANEVETPSLARRGGRGTDDLARFISTRIVHHDDHIDENGDAPNRREDTSLLVVGRHDDTDTLALEHRRAL